MSIVKIRKLLTAVEDTLSEGGRMADVLLRKAAVTAICTNPHAGIYAEDLSDLIELSVEVGNLIAPMTSALMGTYPIQSYGKGAIVGLAGELEHAEAVLTTDYGNTMRDAAGGGKAWICHMAKRGAAGSSIDIPLAHKDALTVRSHYDYMTVHVPDGPMPDEIAITCCFANRGRLNHRIGGHSVENIIGIDGLK